MLRPGPCSRKIAPMDDPARQLEPYPAPAVETASAIFSAVARTGEWVPPEVLEVRAWCGSAKLDFCDALLAPGLTVVDVSCVFGSVEIFVPAYLQVEVAASALLGAVEQRDAGGRVGRFIADQLGRVTGGALGRREPPPLDDEDDPPVLRIEGRAIFGSIVVKTR
jgi:hypothetical protein